MDRNPLITVLMPVYNGARFLREAIQSILDQTCENFEFLIIDDGSTDASAAIIQSYQDSRIRFVQNQRNLGLIATLNEGLDRAEGAFVARMDQDDVSAPDRLEKQRAALLHDPELVAVGTALTLLSVNGKMVGVLPMLIEHEQIKRALAVTNPFAHSSMMLRRDAVLRIGGYSPDAYPIEDYELWVRLCAVGRMANLDQCLLGYRSNHLGMSISLRRLQKAKAEKIFERVWQSFGEDGPAPLRDWDKIWPHTKAKQLTLLHLLFAKAYRKRGMWGLALRHFCSSFGWSVTNRSSYLATLMFFLPYHVYFWIEERIAIWLMSSRASGDGYFPRLDVLADVSRQLAPSGDRGRRSS